MNEWGEDPSVPEMNLVRGSGAVREKERGR